MTQPSTPKPLLVATGNAHKLGEIAEILRALLPNHTFDLLCAGDFEDIPEPEENGADFAANALIKARAYAAATGLLTLADDSGLVIDALDGRPGVISARYAPNPAQRIARVLRELDGVPPLRRTARFICVMALIAPDGRETLAEGRVEGAIAYAPRGAGGFGYDPIFELREPGLERFTLAEVPAEQKNALSHRARALQALATALSSS